MNQKDLENKLRSYKVTSLKLLKELADNPVVTTITIGNASIYNGQALGGQLGTLSRENLAIRAGSDEDGNQRWQLNSEIDRDWLKKFIKDLNI